MELRLPKNVKFILETYKNAGYEAHCVGGCVRDMLMGYTPQDYDFATNAPCEVTTELFEKVIPTGIKHGTVTVMLSGEPYEITRYRIDGEYHDHRRPDSVTFTKDFKEDLSRRDFTANAIGYNPDMGLFDPYGGEADIKAGIIRTVGEPDRRFSEDALRTLRGIRFSSRLRFQIEKSTLDSIIRNASTLSSVSAERIAVELIKTMAGKVPSLISIIINAGGLKCFGLEGCGDLNILDKLPASPLLRLAALVIICSADAKDVCDKLKLSRTQKKVITGFCDILKRDSIDCVYIKTQLEALGYENCFTAISGYGVFYGVNTSTLQKDLETAKLENHPYCLDMLAIKGGDIMAMGFAGKEIRKAQEFLLGRVLENHKLNEIQSLKFLLEEFRKS